MATWRGRWNLVCLFLFCANVLQCIRTSASECTYPVAQTCQPCDPVCAVNCTVGGERSLEEILQDFADGRGCTVGGNESCCTVYVPSTEHAITRDLYFGNKSLRLIGMDAGDGTSDRRPVATLRCNLSQSDSPPTCNPSFPSSYGTLPCLWGFTGSDHVYFEGIAMEGCPGPVSIEGAARVDVVNSTFRYILHITGLVSLGVLVTINTNACTHARTCKY